jgi:hypothetical protein
MTEPQPNASTPSAEHYSASRAQVLNEAFNSLVLLHGGGALALIAFLQDNWGKYPALSKVIVSGIGFLVVGLVLAIPIPLLRYRHSHLWEQREKARLGNDQTTVDEIDKKRRPYVRAYLSCYVFSMVCFAFAAGWIVCGALRMLP